MINSAILRPMLRVMLTLCLLMPGNGAFAQAASGQGPWLIEASVWAQPRHGDWLVNEPALQAAMGALEAQGGRLEIRYPGGDSGSLWAGELRAWLVSLGLSSAAIDMRPGAASDQQIELRRIESTE